MNIRRGYSEKNLKKVLKNKQEDNGNFENFLPSFLMKDLHVEDEKDKNDVVIEDDNNYSTFFDSNDDNKLLNYLENIKLEEVKIKNFLNNFNIIEY
jgi:hypothetical protein